MIPPFNKIKDQTQMIRESLPLILIKIKPKIETLVKLRRMQLIYEGYDERIKFWGYYCAHTNPEEEHKEIIREECAREQENRMKENFKNLSPYLLERVSKSKISTKERIFFKKIRFEVTFISYESLIIGVCVYGAKALADVFGFDYDFLTLLLEEFINEEFNPDFYDNDIQIPPEIRNAFDNNDSEKKKPLHNERIRNLRLVSDLLPWILSFIVLAFMAYYFTEDRKYLIERTKEVNLAQQHLLNLY